MRCMYMNIKVLRKQMNMSQKEFANRFHLSVRSLQNWEQNKNSPPEYLIPIINEIIILSQKNSNFYLFRSEIHHEIKRNALQFVLNTLYKKDVDIYYNNGMFLECFYLLACIDTLCEKYNLPLCSDFNCYRKMKLEEPVYLGEKQKDQEYLPNFKRYNIYKVTLYDAC